MSRLSVKNLHVAVGEAELLRGVDMDARPGEIIAVIGPNGAGKTTLLRAIVGLTAARGAIAIGGEDVSRQPAHLRARKLAYLPQAAAIHWPMRVRDLVALGRLPHLNPWRKARPEDAAAIDQAMADAGVRHLQSRLATSLSGGERSRVLFARALATGTDLLLADEPVAALDPAHQLRVMNLLAGLKTAGKTVIVVLHDLPLAAHYADRLLLLDKGRAHGFDKPDKVLSPGNLEQVYGVRPGAGFRDLAYELTSV